MVIRGAPRRLAQVQGPPQARVEPLEGVVVQAWEAAVQVEGAVGPEALRGKAAAARPIACSRRWATPTP